MDQYKDLHCTLGAMKPLQGFGQRSNHGLTCIWKNLYSFYIENKCRKTLEAGRLVGEARKSLQMLTVATKLKDACSLEEKL